MKKTNYIDKIIKIILLIIIIAFFSKYVFASSTDYVIPTEVDKLKKNAFPVDVENILKINTSNQITEEIAMEEIDLEYITEYKNNSDLPKGTMQVIQEGKDGLQKVVAIKKYENEELVSEKIVSDNVLKASINKIVEIGTGKGKNTYQAKIGDTCYVTADTASVRLEADANSDKLCTLRKNTEVKILQIVDDWYYILSTERKGYIDKNCVTNKNPNNTNEITENAQYSKKELISKLNFDMDLNEPSGFSLEQFKTVLSGNSLDKNSVFENNAEYFYYAEKQYHINGIFLAALGIHESAWGTSTIASNKNNLFGYGAVDSNPYGGAYSFDSYNESIDLVARVLVKYYINPNGKEIYDGNIANGKFYSGNTIASVNKKYASDPNWGKGVYKWMQFLYNNL